MYAIDREAVVKYLLGNSARVLHLNAIRPNSAVRMKVCSATPYDPAKARKLLIEAGFPKGFDVDIYAYRDRNQIEAIIGFLTRSASERTCASCRPRQCSPRKKRQGAMGSYGISRLPAISPVPSLCCMGSPRTIWNRDPKFAILSRAAIR